MAKKIPANNNKSWTNEDVNKLKKMAGTRPTGIIAYELGRSENAIYAKASKEDISLNPSNRSPYNKHNK